MNDKGHIGYTPYSVETFNNINNKNNNNNIKRLLLCLDISSLLLFTLERLAGIESGKLTESGVRYSHELVQFVKQEQRGNLIETGKEVMHWGNNIAKDKKIGQYLILFTIYCPFRRHILMLFLLIY